MMVRELMRRRPAPQGCRIEPCPQGYCWGREVEVKPKNEPQAPPYTRAGAEVTSERLIAGAVVDRWTDNDSRGRNVWAPLPCHPAQWVHAGVELAEVIVQCRLCAHTYLLEVVDDSDGGFTARFTVSYVPVLLSRSRGQRSS